MSYRNLVNKGIDPRANNDGAEQTQLTLGLVADQWFQKYKSSWKDFARNRHEKSISRDMSSLGNKPIDDIIKADLLNIIKPHEELGHHDVAHRLYARLQSIFEFAVGSSLTTNYPFIGLKKVLMPKPKVKNQPAINASEAHDMMLIIKKTNSTKIVKLYMELLAHVFTRPAITNYFLHNFL